ncbi:ATPase AAA [Anopheles sinensis]|uniref:ATPase AAA n=1 Tax=Anopheles sinensis TaxID=74873 RepID=A0A084W7E7_ANOSI|nr:ATPase AAA [Anopheles sinensis]
MELGETTGIGTTSPPGTLAFPSPYAAPDGRRRTIIIRGIPELSRIITAGKSMCIEHDDREGWEGVGRTKPSDGHWTKYSFVGMNLRNMVVLGRG